LLVTFEMRRPAVTGRLLAILFGAAIIAATLLQSLGGGAHPATGSSLGAKAAIDAAPAAAVIPAPRAKAAPAAFNAAAVDLHLTLVKSGLSNPVFLTNAGDGSGRLFVVEQTGRIRIITAGGALLGTPFLDIHTAISTGGERGLLGLAFHPSYATNGYFYVNYTRPGGETAVTRFKVSSNPDVADRNSGYRIITVGQPYANHNGGHIAFGPDGFLYIGMGDGGSAGDPGNRAQNINSMLGKMLRLDVNHTSGSRHYRSPSSNPYVGRTGLDEIWSRGLRNPWGWSFDSSTHRLWIADVGQGRYEEINRSNKIGTQSAGRGLNYGWRQLEGRACFKPSSGCSKTGKAMPLVVYTHAGGNCSVTGGYVYRGSASPVLVGGYVYGDFCSGRIWVVNASALTPASGRIVWASSASPHLQISAFGLDEAKELYVLDLAGRVFKVSAT
jgi:glucose/arabinose dehydrogenase